MNKKSLKNLLTPEELNARLTPEQRSENGRKAGKASAKARRDKRCFRETVSALLQMPMVDKVGNEIISPITGKPISIREQIITAMLQKATKGDIKTIQTILDVLGERTINLKNDVSGSINAKIERDERPIEDVLSEIERLSVLTDIAKQKGKGTDEQK